HGQAGPAGATEADVGADLREGDAGGQPALGASHRYRGGAHGAAGVARAPEIAVDVAPHAVRAALHAVDHEIAEELPVGDLVVRADVEGVHLALAAGAGVARTFAGADDVELLVVRRERQPVRIRDLILADDQLHLAARIDAIDVGRQLALVVAHADRLTQPRLETAGRVARTTGRVRRALVELAAVRRIGEPVRPVGMRHDVVGRVEALALEPIGDHGDRAVVLVAHHAAGQVLAGQFA